MSIDRVATRSHVEPRLAVTFEPVVKIVLVLVIGLGFDRFLERGHCEYRAPRKTRYAAASYAMERPGGRASIAGARLRERGLGVEISPGGPPPKSWSTFIVMKTEDQRWRLSDTNRKRL